MEAKEYTPEAIAQLEAENIELVELCAIRREERDSYRQRAEIRGQDLIGARAEIERLNWAEDQLKADQS